MIAYLPPIIPPARRGADLVLRVEEITGRSGLGQFVSVPHHLYRGDHRWIPPIRAARRDALRPERNPLLTGGAIVALRVVAQNLGLGDETVALLAAWSLPRSALENQPGGWGCWGLLEAVNVEEPAERLLSEAENWIFEHTPGIRGIRGPCSLEPLVSPGLLTDGFDAQPAAFLPYNPPYYPDLVEGQGYEPGPTWRAYSLSLPAEKRALRPVAHITTEQWRQVARAYAAHVPASADQALLTPGLGQWLDHLSGPGAFAFGPSWQRMMGSAFRRAIAVISGNGEGDAAACFGIPDLGPALRLSGGRSFPLGWPLFEIGLRRTRRLHVFPAAAPEGWHTAQVARLYASVAAQAGEAGYLRVEIAPVRDDDERTVEALARNGAKPAQQFTVYQKDL